jgi:hypothetical protein
MSLTQQEVNQVLDSARNLALNAAAKRVEDFIGRSLGLNPFQQAQYFPDPDPNDLLAIAVARLTRQQEEILRNEAAVPTFAVYDNALGIPSIAGLSTYLEFQGISNQFISRLSNHSEIRNALRSLRRGQHLEALAAAIMSAGCDSGEATRGSGDQGIDAIGWKELLPIHSAFSNVTARVPEVLPGEKVFLFASSKAVLGTRGGLPTLLNPAHIRELVGGWIIQRSSAGMWRPVGIRMLSPVQMILVTTYRLSADARAECSELGVQIWGIPELIYLVCRWAPDAAFNPVNGFVFDSSAFRDWWKAREQTRLMAS